MEKKFSLSEDINSFVVVCYRLVEHKSLGAMINLLHDLFLTVDHLVWFFLVNMALEMIFVVWLPRSRTHITKILATSASHEVATHRSLHSFLAPWTYLSICTDPLRICLLCQHLFEPFRFLLTFARIVIVRHTPKAEYLPTGATNW